MIKHLKWLLSFSLSLSCLISFAQSDTLVHISDLKPVDGVLNLDGQAYTGTAYFIKKDGNPMVMRSYVNGIKEGLWKTWHPNGNLYKAGSVKQGKEDGEYREYYENGILKYQYQYKMGVKHGKWLGWYESGKPYTERNFKEGKLDGNLIHYDEEGNPRLSELYREGRLIASDRMKVKGSGVNIKQE